MKETNESDLLRRIETLERQNRLILRSASALLLLPLLAVVGWQAVPQVQTKLQVRQLEVVDERGVPMVTLTTGRENEGGAITLRDKMGERRAWWTSSPDGASLAMTKEKAANAEGGHTAGLSVTSSSSEMSLIGPSGAMFSASVREGDPRLDLWGTRGDVLFGAPWKNPERN